jgi:carbon monoxide dehydrogenase subunit G
MPGATLEAIEGEEFRGRVKVKVGPIQVTYTGMARFAERDDAKLRAVIEARGKEARGTGTAAMTVTAQLHEENGATRVTTLTDLAVTGRPAQFGRGVLAEVGEKLIGQFAACLATRLRAGPEAEGEAKTEAPQAGTEAAKASEAAEAPAGEPAPPTTPPPEAAPAAATAASSTVNEEHEERPPSRLSSPEERPTPDVIDLFDTAGTPILKRLGPVLAVLAVLTVILVGWRRARRRR